MSEHQIYLVACVSCVVEGEERGCRGWHTTLGEGDPAP